MNKHPAHGTPEALSREELARYSRHLLIPDVGHAGQERLKKARVLCIGAGGLGSPATLYLAAAGVGTLGLVDFDKVELSNLQRQILHGTSDVGRQKLDSARDSLREINPHVQIEAHSSRFTRYNGLALVSRYDVVVDGSDNFPTRYLSNDVCIWAGRPNVYGSVYRFDGQATVFAPHLGGPCYRCLFPEPPPPGSVPSCAEAGVLGILPGLIGLIQATEAIKLILGIGQPLIGRLLHVDALKMSFREFKLRRDPQCPVCGESPSITEPVDYEVFCGVAAEEIAEKTPTVSVHDLKRKLETKNSILILDVREPFEYDIARIEGSKLIPLGDLPNRIKELKPSDEIIAHCKSGVRSARAVELLRQAGFEHVYNLEGGIDAWAIEIDPTMERY